MKRFLPVIIFLVLVIGACEYGYNRTVPNEDPNHTHADFAVWINGQQVNFAQAKYMTAELTPAQLEALSKNTDTGSSVEFLKQYLHLHDMNGHVVHRHKPGLTFGDFLTSLGFSLQEKYDPTNKDISKSCVTDPDGRIFCDDLEHHQEGWQVLVNDAQLGCERDWRGKVFCGKPNIPFTQSGVDIVNIWHYAFQDGDKILLSYGPFFKPNEEAISPDTQEMRYEWSFMTDDACKYSKTCPGRGPAPTESCISDPTIPCKAP